MLKYWGWVIREKKWFARRVVRPWERGEMRYWKWKAFIVSHFVIHMRTEKRGRQQSSIPGSSVLCHVDMGKVRVFLRYWMFSKYQQIRRTQLKGWCQTSKTQALVQTNPCGADACGIIQNFHPSSQQTLHSCVSTGIKVLSASAWRFLMFSGSVQQAHGIVVFLCQNFYVTPCWLVLQWPLFGEQRCKIQMELVSPLCREDLHCIRKEWVQIWCSPCHHTVIDNVPIFLF